MKLPEDKKKRLFIFLGGTVAVLCLVSLFEPIYAPICHHNEYSDTEHCRPERLVIALIHDLAVFVNDASVFLTALATIGLVGVTYLLVRLGEDQSVTGKTQLRAYVFAVDLKQYWERNAAGHYEWRFRPVWRNSGNTPTRALAVHTECLISATPLSANFNFSYPVIPGAGLIAPNQASEGGLAPEMPKPPVTPQDILDVQAGLKFIYLFGWVRYRDVFPKTPEHITRFCWSLVFTGDPTTFVPNDPNHPLRIDWIYQIRGNCADDECAAAGLG